MKSEAIQTTLEGHSPTLHWKQREKAALRWLALP